MDYFLSQAWMRTFGRDTHTNSVKNCLYSRIISSWAFLNKFSWMLVQLTTGTSSLTNSGVKGKSFLPPLLWFWRTWEIIRNDERNMQSKAKALSLFNNATNAAAAACFEVSLSSNLHSTNFRPDKAVLRLRSNFLRRKTGDGWGRIGIPFPSRPDQEWRCIKRTAIVCIMLEKKEISHHRIISLHVCVCRKLQLLRL